MKSIVLGTSLFFAASTAFAGNYDPPYIDPPVIIEDAANSSTDSGGIVLGIMTLLLFGAAAAN